MREIGYFKEKAHKGIVYAVVPCCPFCGEKHTHGGKVLDERSYLQDDVGIRTAHCHKGEYFLRQIGDKCFSAGILEIKDLREI